VYETGLVGRQRRHCGSVLRIVLLNETAATVNSTAYSCRHPSVLTLKRRSADLHLNPQSVPRCKHFILVIKTNQFFM
jgi:hypothetical protein